MSSPSHIEPPPLPHSFHVQQVNRENCDRGEGATELNMTFISAKMKSAGYQTIHVGKWRKCRG